MHKGSQENNDLLHKKDPYKTMESRWTLYDDAYSGIGGFDDGTYLHRGIGEVDYRYDIRKGVSTYLNLYRPAIDKFDGWLNSGTIQYGENASADFVEWAEKIDLPKILKKASKYALKSGNSPIIADMEESGSDPYLVPYPPMALYDWQEHLDVGGEKTGKYESAKIVIEHFISDVAKGKTEKAQIIFIWTPEVMQKWVKKGDEIKKVINEPNKLKFAPLINLDFTSGDDETINIPVFDSLARMCKEIFNTMSERWAFATSGLINPIITVPVPDGQEAPKFSPEHNTQYYDPRDGGAPDQLESSPQPYEAFSQGIKDSIEQAAYASGLNSPTSYIYPKSGEAWRQQSVDTVAMLKSMTAALEQTIINIADVWQALTGKPDHNVNPTWPTPMVEADTLSIDDIENHEQSELFNLSPVFRRYVSSERAKLITRGNVEVFNDVLDDIKNFPADAGNLPITGEMPTEQAGEPQGEGPEV